MSWEIEFDNLPIGYAVTSAKPGEEVSVAAIEFTSTEDGEHFISRLEGFPSEILQRIGTTPTIQASSVDHMLVIVRPDKTGTAYVNELAIKGLMQPKRDVKAGEAIFTNDIADISQIRFEGIDIQNEHGVLFLFSIGWRKGMYFDFSPLHPKDGVKRTYDLNKRLAQFYVYLMFQDRFKIPEDTWNEMFAQGWFPFISLTLDTTKAIINHARNSWCIDDVLKTISNEVKDRLPRWLEKWKRLGQFSDHYTLLEKSVERFENRDFISSVSILYPRIEGVMRSRHYSVSPNLKGTQQNLISSTFSEVDSDLNPKLLLLPEKFRKYLDEVYFASFDPKDPKGPSRNTVSHGVADAADFSEKSACIGFLILEQLTYYHSSEVNSNNSLNKDEP
jgi:hypothetical protein